MPQVAAGPLISVLRGRLSDDVPKDGLVGALAEGGEFGGELGDMAPAGKRLSAIFVIWMVCWMVQPLGYATPDSFLCLAMRCEALRFKWSALSVVPGMISHGWQVQAIVTKIAHRL